jgi:hypothetical protein
VAGQRLHRLGLPLAEPAGEGDLERGRLAPRVVDLESAAGLVDERRRRLGETPRQVEVLEVLRVAADEPRRGVVGHPQPLALVELRVVEHGEVFERRVQARIPARRIASIPLSCAAMTGGGAGSGRSVERCSGASGPTVSGRRSSTVRRTSAGVIRPRELRNANWSGKGSNVRGSTNTVVPRSRRQEPCSGRAMRSPKPRSGR